MEKVIPNGTNVIIYDNISGDGIRRTRRYTMGIVKESHLSEPYNYDELPWYERNSVYEEEGPFHVRIYTVVDEEGKEHTGSYGRGISGDSFFLTVDDRLSELDDEIGEDFDRINSIMSEINEFTDERRELEDKQIAYSLAHTTDDWVSSLIQIYSTYGELDGAITYAEDENHFAIVLVYNDWNDRIERLADHGIVSKEASASGLFMKTYAADKDYAKALVAKKNCNVLFDRYGEFVKQGATLKVTPKED